MLPPEGPPSGAVVKWNARFKSIGDMAIFTNFARKYPLRVRVLVAGHTPGDFNGPKLALVEMTFLTLNLSVLTR